MELQLNTDTGIDDCTNETTCATIFQDKNFGGWSQCLPLQGISKENLINNHAPC